MAEYPAAREIARIGMLALTQPAAAAVEFKVRIGEPMPELVRAMHAFAKLTEAEMLAFEANAPDMLVRGPWGELWLCPVEPRDFDGALPWVTLRAMHQLGVAVVAPPSEEDAFLANAWGV